MGYLTAAMRQSPPDVTLLVDLFAIAVSKRPCACFSTITGPTSTTVERVAIAGASTVLSATGLSNDPSPNLYLVHDQVVCNLH